MYDGEPLVNSGVDNDALGYGYGGADEDDALAALGELPVTTGGEVGGLFSGEAGLAVLAVVEHLLLLGTFQKEEAAEGGIVAPSDAEVETALQEGRQVTAHNSAQGVVSHVALDGVKHPWPLDDAVVVALLEERAPLSRS